MTTALVAAIRVTKAELGFIARGNSARHRSLKARAVAGIGAFTPVIMPDSLSALDDSWGGHLLL